MFVPPSTPLQVAFVLNMNFCASDFSMPVCAAKLLEAPVTLLWALQQAQACFAGHLKQVVQCVTVHFVGKLLLQPLCFQTKLMLLGISPALHAFDMHGVLVPQVLHKYPLCAGAQKEVALWPVFLELLPLMPCQHMQLHYISPDVPNDMDGSCQAFTLQQQSASQPSQLQQVINSHKSAVQSAWDPSTLSYICSHQQQALEESDLPAQHASQPYIAVPSQTHHAAADSQQHSALQASEKDQSSQSLQLSFHTGCYHDVASSLQQKHGRPDLVFGANAGVFCNVHDAVWYAVYVFNCSQCVQTHGISYC